MDKLAPTIVVHLAKDGYMFIHPFLIVQLLLRKLPASNHFPIHLSF